jgi:hypothetical protein
MWDRVGIKGDEMLGRLVMKVKEHLLICIGTVVDSPSGRLIDLTGDGDHRPCLYTAAILDNMASMS